MAEGHMVAMLILGDEPRAGNDLQQLGQLRRVLHIQFARAVAVNGLGGHRGKGLDGVVAAAVGTHQHHQQRKERHQQRKQLVDQRFDDQRALQGGASRHYFVSRIR
ncbi:hypothetical protein G6F32_016562 [Rhizopus arrhizus]|nr:hypothetical protein G6F32_016562 [Rhizopus arrhizus]